MKRNTLLWAVVLCSACSKSSAPPAQPEPAASSAGGAPTKAEAGAMWHHFWDVAVTRDALIQGSVEQARQSLLQLAADRRDDNLPADWLQWVGEMRAEAAKAKDAKTLPEMVNVFTQVSEQCAECHRTTRGGPPLKVDNLDYGQHQARGLQGVMARHAWAADELWVGMTVPSYSSWAAGARALGEFPLPGSEESDGGAAASNDPSIDAKTRERLEAVRALGKKAEAAGQPFEQMAVYSELIVQCGECHQTLEKKPVVMPEVVQ